jgi:ABC-2 type transport system ATP-binding protein
MAAAIKVDNLTKDYGGGRGVFNVSLEIGEGEVYGFLGANGAGKTTVIRHLLGFLKPDAGKTYVNGVEVWGNAHITNRDIGYVPGEIAFPERMRGADLIKWLAGLSGVTDTGKARRLADLLQLKNLDGGIKNMSKGMKQKLGIICAFMHDPKILILDEPSGGLDPLMQSAFTELLRGEKAAGKTILLSSHIFSEVEKICDKVSIIRQGELAASFGMDGIKRPRVKTFEVKFAKIGESRRIEREKLNLAEIDHEENRVKVTVDDKDIKSFMALLLNYEIEYLTETKPSLEDRFMKFYSEKTGSVHSQKTDGGRE